MFHTCFISRPMAGYRHFGDHLSMVQPANFRIGRINRTRLKNDAMSFLPASLRRDDGQAVDRHRGLDRAEFFGSAESRVLAWARRPQAAALVAQLGRKRSWQDSRPRGRPTGQTPETTMIDKARPARRTGPAAQGGHLEQANREAPRIGALCAAH
jgi:hypothetical protein